MTNYQWVGAASTSASTASNWLPVGSPAAGDVVIFDSSATQDCDWDIALPASAFSVDEIILESTFLHSLNLTNNMRVKGLFLNGTVAPAAGTKILFEHGASPNFFGSYKTYNERFVLIGDNGDATGVSFEMVGSATPVTKFDDGAHPTVTLNAGRFAPDYVAPTGTSGKATFDSFTVSSPTDFSPDGDLVDNDRLKVFSFTAFSITSTSIDFGLATAEFYATVGGFYIPTAGANGMPSGFEAYYRKIVLKGNTAGHKCLMSDNTYISVEEFEIDDGVVLKGPVDDTSQGADIRSIKTPKLRGTWSFSQVTPGIYRSPRHASGPMPKVNGDFHITGKLDVDGLIDPTGLELNPQATNPGGVAANTLWLNSGDSNKLYLGSSEVGGGGGGGSGTVTSVDMSVPTGFTISGNPITGAGTLALAFDTGYALPTSAKQTQWDTAYGWGDHSTQGYLTSTPPETDPVFSIHPASGITNAGSGDVSQGDTAFSWGDHAAAGYLTSESDPVYSTSEAALFAPGDAAKLASIPSPEICVVRLATGVANFTPTGAYTLLQKTGNWDDSSNSNFDDTTGLYTVPSDGVYSISWNLSFRFAGSNLQASRIYVNGNTAAQGNTTSDGSWPVGGGSVLLSLSQNDTVGLYVYIGGTGATLVGDNLLPFSNHMSIHKVSN